MRTLRLVALHPCIELGLNLLALADPIGLRMPDLCARVILALS